MHCSRVIPIWIEISLQGKITLRNEVAFLTLVFLKVKVTCKLNGAPSKTQRSCTEDLLKKRPFEIGFISVLRLFTITKKLEAELHVTFPQT